MLDKVAAMLGMKRWYDKPFAKVEPEMVGDRFGGWVGWWREKAQEHIKKNENVLFDWENIHFDSEHGSILVSGYLPTKEGSVHKGKIAGTTLKWNIPWDGKPVESIEALKKKLMEQVGESRFNIFMHGHTGNVVDTDSVAQTRQGYDQKHDVKSIQLSLGLMGADGTCLSSEVDPGETPLAQVTEVLGQLGDQIPDFMSKVGLVWGHSMQGNTVLQLAGEMGGLLPNAEFNAVAPVIYGSERDDGVPYQDKHVWLHAGVRGALVKLLPIIHLIPKVNKDGDEIKAKGRVVEFINRTGIPAQVLGYFIRDHAMAASHFTECMENPFYLDRVNIMLKQMTDLRKAHEINTKVSDLSRRWRLWITADLMDTILNPKPMLEYGRNNDVRVVKLSESGHFPKETDLEKAVVLVSALVGAV